MEMLKFDLVKGKPPRLCIEGDIDLSTADEFLAALKEALSVDPSVIVDMEGVTFIDVCGLRAVLEVAESRNGAGPLTLVNASRVAWLLEVVGLNELPSIEIRDGGTPRGR
jgi:anti-anti-sigma factor